MEELKKCPFCGGKAFIPQHIDGTWCTWVVCNDCHTESGYCETKEEAITTWNTREPMERIVERLEKCVASHNRRAKITKDLNEAIRETQYGGCYYNAIEIVKKEMS